ncbi:ABC-F family ATP-binding cassette domain-containing protein [Candidatus Beckwithbacteria bacterium]|nr:ABC-F family ATP-binding cassette domain-containing protein [Candidatus Beckwithbacteria bacterium]
MAIPEMRERLASTELIASVYNLSYYSFENPLFVDLSFLCKRREVTAVTGKSGSGKTVLLKTLAGRTQPESGNINIFPEARVAYAPQEIEDLDLDQNITIESLLKETRGLNIIEAQQREYEDKGDYGDEYLGLLEYYQEIGGYNFESDAGRILNGLGININNSHISLETRLNQLSSGQLRKVILASALYAQPDLLLLDDPTANLDVKSVDWLVGFLKQTKAAVVLTSNNGEFIDRCATQTIGLNDSGRTFAFTGGYTAFTAKREALIEAERLEAQSVRKEADQLDQTLRKFRAGGAFQKSADMAQVGRALTTRRDRKREEYAAMPGSQDIDSREPIPDLSFEVARPSGNDILSIRGVVKAYGDFEAVDLRRRQPIMILRGEKWLVWGENGSGKSTLARMIAHSFLGGDFLPDQGQLNTGKGNVDLAYFAPDLDVPATSDSIIKNFDSQYNQQTVARVLRFFGFRTRAIYDQPADTLSFGEKRRLALARIMLAKPNTLLLDEPTGDFMPLDVKQRLAKALSEYKGTLILVSHDTEFIKLLKLNKKLNMPRGNIDILG